MKKKHLISTGLLGMLVVLFIYSCQKDSTGTNHNGGETKSSSHTISTFQDSDEQLKWIAKGFASLVFNSTLKNSLETDILAATNSQELIETLNSNYSFASQLTTDLNNIFPSNYYNPNYLEGMTINSDDYKTFIEIPEPYSISHLEFLIAPNLKEFSNSNNLDQVYGYFKSGSTIDSVLITEETYDLFYIWVVDLVTDDIFSSIPNPGLGSESTPTPPPPCNFDRICDPGTGEYLGGCSDCHDTVNYNYRVVIRHIYIGTDEKPWSERFLSGKYEFASCAAEIGPYGDGSDPNWVDDGAHHVFASIKRKDACRKTKNGNFKGSGCPGVWYGLKNGDYVLDDDFNPYNDLAIIFYEWDESGLKAPNVLGTTPHTATLWSKTWNPLFSNTTLKFSGGDECVRSSYWYTGI